MKKMGSEIIRWIALMLKKYILYHLSLCMQSKRNVVKSRVRDGKA